MQRLALALGLVLCAGGAHAQVSGVRVVVACGAPAPYGALNSAVGSPAWLAVDTNMTFCTNATGGGGGGGGLSVIDSAGWTATVSPFTPTGGEYNPAAAVLTPGTQGTVALDANRNMMVNGGVVQADVVPVAVTNPLQAQANASSDVQLVAAVASKSVHVTGWQCVVDQAAAGSGACQLVQGTGTNCATGKANLTFKYTYAQGNGHNFGSNLGNFIIANTSQAVCAEFSTTNLTTISVQAHIQ